jgi:uncharacterized damage-inducible protein DinB
MSTGWNAHFDMLARYNVWATGRLLAAVQVLPDDDYRRDAGLFFTSIHGTLNHLLVGEHRLWFVRFSEGTSPRVALDAEVETDRARLAASLREGAARWAPLIVFNHGTHHRGQITAALTALGQPCPVLDYVYFLQNPAQP